jgi:quinol monooxygenase YgiN
MSTLTIVAKITAITEHRALVKSELQKLITPTRAEEGCINYDLHQDNENPDVFLFFENWESLELLEMHLANTHIAAYSEATKGAVASFELQKMTQIG